MAYRFQLDTPCCPYCGEIFTNWSHAKKHVKHCWNADGSERRQPYVSRDKYFEGGNFLKAPDIKEGQTFTVEKFEEIKTHLSKNPRPCLRLTGIEKPLGLNATNYDKMVEKFGDVESKWTGKKIRLILVTTNNPSDGNKSVKGIRIE